MIRRNTWILLILLAAVVGFAFYWNHRKAGEAASPTPTAAGEAPTPLFPATDGSVSGLRLQDATGKSVEITRDSSGTWVLKAPTEAPADQAAAEAAATQAASLRAINTVELGLDVVGLDKPAYTATVTFSGGKSHTLIIGAETPIQNGYYCKLDGGAVQVVDKPGIEALIQLLERPPYAATATPPATETPAATETQAAPAETSTGIAAPEASATASAPTQAAGSPTP